jgi:hypothetical protein
VALVALVALAVVLHRKRGARVGVTVAGLPPKRSRVGRRREQSIPMAVPVPLPTVPRPKAQPLPDDTVNDSGVLVSPSTAYSV